MKQTEPDNRVGHEAERLGRVVDEALRELSQASPPATLKARVMAAWDERTAQGARATVRGSRRGWWIGPALLRPAAALTGSLVIVLGVFLVWQHVDREFSGARHERPGTTARTQTQPSPADRPVDSSPTVQQADANSPTGSADAGTGLRRRPRSRLVTVEWPVEQLADAGPHLPGAPAGNLGDPIEPMDASPPITFSPIVPSPLISDIARPVSEFPAETQSPAGTPADAGRSGGPRR